MSAHPKLKPVEWHGYFAANRERLQDLQWLGSFIKPHCHIRSRGIKGRRPRIIQYPMEFAVLLSLLAEHKCKTYFEIGTSDGGGLMMIDSYLRAAVEGYDHAEGVDTKLRDWSEYQAAFPKTVFHHINSAEIDLGETQFDAALVDACHFDPWILRDFEKVKNNARIVAFHDIALQGADVGQRWNEIKTAYRHWELIDQTIPEPERCGIGVIQIK